MFGHKSKAALRDWKLTVAVFVVCLMSGVLMVLVGFANFVNHSDIPSLLSMCSGLVFMGISLFKLLMLMK